MSPNDIGLLLGHKWSALPKPPKNRDTSKIHYRVTVMHSINGRGTVMIHRSIMKPADGLLVDHINRNCLDNRRENLRICTPSQNTANSRKPVAKEPSSSKFKGVSWDKKRAMWRAGYEHFNKNNFIGFFQTEEDAHIAYVAAAKLVWGEFARAA